MTQHTANDWQPIETAPRNQRILLLTPAGNIYAGEHVTNITNGEAAWRIATMPGGDSILIAPTHWASIPGHLSETARSLSSTR